MSQIDLYERIVKEKSNLHTCKINRACYPHLQRLKKLPRFRIAETIGAEKLLVDLPFVFAKLLAAPSFAAGGRLAVSGNLHAAVRSVVIEQEYKEAAAQKRFEPEKRLFA